ncbi:MAG: dephospho-CoA kinase [Chloroflexi bacterium RBG_13_46_9]|jgi:dephospho-CoA kinase|nr:MAG: dephospho-CoA kinase [Chloroflexi bacterium RBG_13_46_9]
MTKVVGLTGGMGSGKSTASQIMAELGAVIIDADKVGHEAYQANTKTWQDVVAAFGNQVVAQDGSIDRKKLGAIVFGNPEQLERLNRIVHPRMFEMMKERIEQYRQQGIKVVVLDAAILFEANWTPLVDMIWVVIASETVVVARAVARTGLPQEQIRARLHSQMSNEERIKLADKVIHNDGTIEELRAQVVNLWKQLIRA